MKRMDRIGEQLHPVHPFHPLHPVKFFPSVIRTLRAAQLHSKPESEGRVNWVLGKTDGRRCMERESSDLTPCGV